MTPRSITQGELIYQADIQITDIVEFGFSMEEISSGEVAIPPEGARFDQPFSGSVHGPKLKGRMHGIDHIYVRADGRFELHIHATIRTEDGHNISFSSNGISTQKNETKEAQLTAAVSLFSSFHSYKWLNKLQIWAIGVLDTETGKAFVKAYSI
jgi:hypothetical protein